MTERIAAMSPRFKARLAGLFQLLEALTATYGQKIILDRLIVPGDAATTAANILARESLFRLGFASCVIGVAFHIAWVLLMYELFKPVNRSLSSFAAFVILVGCAVQAFACVFYLAPLFVLSSGTSFNAFPAAQLQTIAFMFLKLNGVAFNLYLVFFGAWCVLIGYLIFRSTFMPRILGVLLTISGVGWTLFLSPPLATHLWPYIAAASALGEIPLELWLLIFGVNNERWKEQAMQEGNPL